MKKLLSTQYNAASFNVALLLLRICFGGYMMMIGLEKMTHFAASEAEMINFLSLGKRISLILVIFAEFFCALFVMIGLFTRLSCIPLIICMSVALFIAHHGDILGDGQGATRYLVFFLSLLLIGPGKYSVDGISGR